MSFGKSPRMFGVFDVRPMLTVDGIWVHVSSALDAVTVMGAPELQPNIAPNCHRSTMRETKFGPLERSLRPGPNGSSNVPLLFMSCVRWKLRSVLLRCWFLGS